MTDKKDLELEFTQGVVAGPADVADLWYYEHLHGQVCFGLKVKEVVHAEESDFQKIEIFDTYKHGRLLVIDGYVMLTELDEFVYHEMMTHPPMQAMSKPRNALIIGGGDGGCVRELVKYPELEKITLVEIDAKVVEICKKHLPKVASGYDDPRVEVLIEDGAKYVKTLEEDSLDLVIVDSTDPIGPGEVLFSVEFYQDLARAMKDTGVLTAQTETPIYHGAAITWIYENLGKAFPSALMYWANIPSYISGFWTFAFASKNTHPVKNHAPRTIDELDCKYYTPELQSGAFALPAVAARCLPEGHPQRR